MTGVCAHDDLPKDGRLYACRGCYKWIVNGRVPSDEEVKAIRAQERMAEAS